MLLSLTCTLVPVLAIVAPPINSKLSFGGVKQLRVNSLSLAIGGVVRDFEANFYIPKPNSEFFVRAIIV